MITLKALVAALPLILSLISNILVRARQRVDEGRGYSIAVADAIREADTAVQIAIAEREWATQMHHTDPTDAAFDSDFQRKL